MFSEIFTSSVRQGDQLIHVQQFYDIYFIRRQHRICSGSSLHSPEANITDGHPVSPSRRSLLKQSHFVM